MEQRLVQQLIAKPTVEAFDEAVLLRLAGRNVMPGDRVVIGPGQHRGRGQFGAVVTDDLRGWPMPAHQFVQFPCDTRTRQ
jgi:hypothetical protein